MLKIHLDEWQLFAFLAVYLVAWTLLAAWLPLSMDNKWFGHEQRSGATISTRRCRLY
ncbi:MAG: hypothetical protein Q8N30_02815 [Methylococcales bacterium]|nr:hypothetical protein [Methylococcales bacterium]